MMGVIPRSIYAQLVDGRGWGWNGFGHVAILAWRSSDTTVSRLPAGPASPAGSLSRALASHGFSHSPLLGVPLVLAQETTLRLVKSLSARSDKANKCAHS